MSVGSAAKRHEVGSDLRDVISEIQRRQLQHSGTNQEPVTDSALIEVAFIDSYGHTPLITDLKAGRSLEVIPVDDDGNRVRVVARHWPMLVFANQLDADSFVFASKLSNTVVEFHGWLPRCLVERLPIRWHERDGVRFSYSHEVDRHMLFPMPQEFRFTDGCEHFDRWFGWWDYQQRAWFCSGCQQFIFDAEEERRIVEQDARLGFASAVS